MFSVFQIFAYGVSNFRVLRENSFDDELLKDRCTPPHEHTERAKPSLIRSGCPGF